MALIQLRIDDELKEQASKLYEGLGLDLSSAIRMFLRRSVSEGGVPFPMQAAKQPTPTTTAEKKEKNEGTPKPNFDSDEQYVEVRQGLMEQGGYVSIAIIQRNFSVGFPRASRYFQQLMEEGLLEEIPGFKPARYVIKND